MRVLSGLLMALLLAGCSPHHQPSATTSPSSGTTSPSDASTPSSTPSGAPSAPGVVVHGRTVVIDLTTGSPRVALGVTPGADQKTFYYRPRGRTAHVAVDLPTGRLTTDAFQVTAGTRPLGSPTAAPDGREPVYLTVLSHYDTEKQQLSALRGQATALGIEHVARQLAARRPCCDLTLAGTHRSDLVVLVEVLRDPDYGGFQTNVEIGLARA